MVILSLHASGMYKIFLFSAVEIKVPPHTGDNFHRSLFVIVILISCISLYQDTSGRLDVCKSGVCGAGLNRNME